MFVSKFALPRRTFLRGAGTALALPLLDAMIPALTPTVKTAAAPVVRMGFIYRPNGYIRQFWTPDKTGANPDFKRSLASLEPYRNQTLIVSGLANLEAEAKGSSPGPHSRSSAAWMTGTHAKQTEGADVYAGISADQVAAQVLGKQTVLPSLELAIEQNEQMVGNCEAGYSCLYQNTFSWRTPTTPLPMETHPRVVFQRLFGDGGTKAEQRRQLQTSGSILDAVTERLGQLSKKLGPSDRARIEQYTESVREIETRIDKAERRTAEASVDVPERPSDIRLRQPGPSSGAYLHTKAIVVDRQHVMVGSMNLDPRSRLHNTEVALFLESSELGARLGTLFDNAVRPALAFRVAIANTGREPAELVWISEEDEKEVRYDHEPASLWRRLLSRLLGALAPEGLL